MKKNNKYLYITINILINIIEPFLIGFVVYYFSASKLNGLIAFAISVVLSIIIGTLVNGNNLLKGIVNETKLTKYDDLFRDVYSKVEHITKKKYNLVYSGVLPNPAFMYKNTLVINTEVADNFNFKYFTKGLISHEAGHAISDFCTYNGIAMFRVSAIFALLFKIPYLLYLTNNTILKALSIIIFIILIPFNIVNYLSYYLFQRYDEYIANYNSMMFYPDSIRYYYYKTNANWTKGLTLLDVTHPTPRKMLDRMNKEMGLNEFDRHFYLYDGKIIEVDYGSLKMPRDEALFKFYQLHRKESEYFIYNYARCLFNGYGTIKDYKQSKKNYRRLSIEYLYDKRYEIDKKILLEVIETFKSSDLKTKILNEFTEVKENENN